MPPVHDQVKYAAWADEFEKIAAPRWRQIMNLGKLDPKDEGRLIQAKVLDFAKDIGGYNARSNRVAKNLGLNVVEKDVGLPEFTANLSGVIPALKRGRFREAYSRVRSGVKDLPSLAASTIAGGGVAIPSLRTIALAPGHNVISGHLPAQYPLARKGVEAVTKRHEINEIAKDQQHKGLGNRTGWLVRKKPVEGSVEDLASQAIEKHPAVRASRVISSAPEKVLGVGRRLAEKVLGNKSRIVAKLQKAEKSATHFRQGMMVPKGELPAGKHMHPDVIGLESGDVARMPSATREAFKRVRWENEQQALKQYGFEYGTKPSPKVMRKVRKAYERGDI